MKVRSNSLIELIDQSHYFFNNPDYSNNELFTKILNENTFRILYLIKNILEEIDSWDDQMIEKKIKDFIIEYDFSFGDVVQPIRFAISGTLNGPSVFTILSILGKETSLNRIDNILNMKRND